MHVPEVATVLYEIVSVVRPGRRRGWRAWRLATIQGDCGIEPSGNAKKIYGGDRYRYKARLGSLKRFLSALL